MNWNGTLRRILSLLMALTICFSVMPWTAFAAEGDTATWTKVELADIQATDTIAITMTTADSVTYALSTTMAGKGPSAPTGTIADGALTLSAEDSAAAGWNLVPTEGGFYIQPAGNSTKYLYTTNSNSGTKTGGTKAVWSLAENGYLTAADTGGNVRYLCVYTTNPDWRSYKESGIVKNQTLAFWKQAPAASATDITAMTPSVVGEVKPGAQVQFQLTGVAEELTWQVSTDSTGWTEAANPYTIPEGTVGKNPLYVRAVLGGQVSLALDLSYFVEGYVRVTSVDELTAGADVVLVAKHTPEGGTAAYYALDTVVNSKITSTVVTAESTELPLWTVEASGTGVSLYNGTEYLAYSDSTNFTKSAAAAAWSVTEEGEDLFRFVADGTTRGIAYQYNNGNCRFGAYAASNATDTKNYIFDLMVYQYVTEDTVTPPVTPEPEPEPEPEPIPATVADGTYVIWYAAAGKAMAALGETQSYGYASSVDVTLTEGTLSGYANTEIFTIHNGADGTFTLTDHYGRTVHMSGTYDSFTVSTDAGVSGSAWTLEDAGNGTYYFKNVEMGKYLAYSAGYGTFGAFAEKSEGSVITLTAAVPQTTEPEPEPTPTGTTATLVTDVTTLAAGDQIVIVASGYNYAMSTTQNNNNRGRAEITKSDDGATVTFGEDTQIITLEAGAVEGTFAFNVGTGYLYAASSSSNHLKTKTALDGNGSWLVEIDSAGIATVKAQGGNTKNWLRHNNGNGIFSCYTTQQTDISIYKLGEPEPETVTDGTYVIWDVNNGKALSNQRSYEGSYYYKGVTVTEAEGVLSGYGNTELWTVTVTDGVLTIVSGSEKLGMSGTYSSISNATGCTDWVLEEAGEGTWYVKNTESGKYITFDTGFGTWSSAATAEKASVLKFTPATEVEEPENPDVPAGIADGEYVLWVGGAYNKALSGTYPNGSYYNAGVDVTLEDGKLSGYGATEIWTVTNNEDGTITLSFGGQNLGMAASYSSLTLGAVNDKWILESAGDGRFYVKNVGRSQYIQWRAGDEYNYFSGYYLSENDNFAINFTPAEEVDEPAGGVADGTYVIWAPGYGMALSTSYPNGSYYNAGVELSVNGEKISGYGATEIWTVTNNDDGTITISCASGKLSMDTSYSSMPLNKVNDTWVLEPAGNGLWYVKNVGRNCYIEWYAGNKYWSGYQYINSGSEGMFALKFTPVEKGYDTEPSIVEAIAQWGGGYSEGAENLLYANGDKFVVGDKLDTEAVLTIMANGKIITPYYNPGANWYMGGNNVGAKEGDYVQLAFSSAGWADMTLAFRLRATNAGPGSFQVQYSTDGGQTFANFTSGSYAYTYTAWGSNGSYPVVGEGTITDGIAKTSAAAGQYISFSFDVPAGAENCGNLLIRLVPGTERASGAAGAVGGNIRIDSVAVTGSPIVDDAIAGHVTVDPNGEEDQPVGTELTMTSATEGAVISYRVNGGEWKTYDEANKPTLESLPCDLEVKASKDGLADSAVLLYHYAAGTVENVRMSPNGGGVFIEGESTEIKLDCNTEGAVIYYATSTDGETFTDYAVYTDPIVIEKGFGKLVIKAYAEKEGFTTSTEVKRTFTERSKAGYDIYFGQLHSHTNISDGAGSVSEAFEHASNVRGLDFLAVTDHSNSFDNEGSGALGTDGSTLSDEWKQGHEAAAAVTDEDFVGLYGFEMTWSNGLGHLNTFNTPGWQSRTQSRYTTASTALQNYYDDLVSVDGSISQFNHPGTTFGDFSDFAHYTESYDAVITLIEVGNGEGAIGSSGYFPSYEYYTRALDKGWHVAPTNNQDNHKGMWGDSNTGRSVVLADSLTEEGIYDALRNYRVYATEDNDLEIYYSLDGSIMGSILDTSDVGGTVTLTVDINDPTDAIGTVEVIVNGGLSIAQQTVSAYSQSVSFTVTSEYNYYYIKITQPDGDIAVTAPVWVGTVEAVGISSLEAESALTIAGEEQTFTMELYNNESKALNIDSIVFTDKATGNVIHTDTTITSVPKTGTASCTFGYTFETDGVYTVTATVKGTLDGVEKTYTKDLELNVMPGNIVSKVIVDGTHYNDYVTGYYGGNTGNMTSIAAAQGIQVHVETEKITAEMLADCSLLVISAPAKKTGTANAGAYEARQFSDEFIAMVADYVKAGGNVIVCGLADYQDKGATFGAEGHSAYQINRLLAGIGSTMTINDDEAYDEEKNGGQAYRLYPENFNAESQWTAGIVTGQTYSQYSGCTVNVGSGTWLVKGFDSTYSIDSDGDGIGGIGKGEAVFLAAEETPYGGTIFAAGGVFVSDFEVKAELDNIWDLPYANRTIYENILGITRTTPAVTPIAEVRASTEEGLGRIFVIEGYVTAGTANEDTKFFDAIYLQDETGGITVFPYSELGLEIGTKMRITGYTDQYQGDKEIQILNYEILDEPKKIIEPEAVSAKDAMDYATNGGELLQVQGVVTEVILTSDGKGVAQFVVKDENGDLAKIFIDGYILSGTTGVNDLASTVKVGNTVQAAGLLYLHPEGDSAESVAVLRVRDCDEVVLIQQGTGGSGSGDNAPTGDASAIVPVLMIMTASVLALAVLVLKRKNYAAK